MRLRLTRTRRSSRRRSPPPPGADGAVVDSADDPEAAPTNRPRTCVAVGDGNTPRTAASSRSSPGGTASRWTRRWWSGAVAEVARVDDDDDGDGDGDDDDDDDDDGDRPGVPTGAWGGVRRLRAFRKKIQEVTRGVREGGSGAGARARLSGGVPRAGPDAQRAVLGGDPALLQLVPKVAALPRREQPPLAEYDDGSVASPQRTVTGLRRLAVRDAGRRRRVSSGMGERRGVETGRGRVARVFKTENTKKKTPYVRHRTIIGRHASAATTATTKSMQHTCLPFPARACSRRCPRTRGGFRPSRGGSAGRDASATISPAGCWRATASCGPAVSRAACTGRRLPGRAAAKTPATWRAEADLHPRKRRREASPGPRGGCSDGQELVTTPIAHPLRRRRLCVSVAGSTRHATETVRPPCASRSARNPSRKGAEPGA